MKTCTKCGEIKPLTDYHNNPAAKDGKRPDCKACVRQRQQANYATKSDDFKSGQHRKVACPNCGKPMTKVSLLCASCAKPGWDPENPRWRVNVKGYVVATGPNGMEIAQHRWVMEQSLGRKLYSHENVHHLNGVRTDNRLENLELWSVSQPAGQRIEDKLAWANWFISQYGNVAER